MNEMTKIILSILMVLTMTIANAQSKKKQVENLTFSLDSLNQAVVSERQSFNTTLDSLNQVLSKNQQDFELELDKSSITINNLNNQLIRLNSINDSINVQLKTKDQKIDSLTLRIQNLLADINSLSKPSDLEFNLIKSNERKSPAGIIYSDGTIMTIADYKIEMLDGNSVIAEFVSEYAAAVYLEAEKDVVRIRSEAGGKTTYTFEKTKDDEVIIFRNFFIPDLDVDEEVWRKTYKKDLNNNWKLINCKGDCN